MKKCCTCKNILSVDFFSKHARESDGLQRRCKLCQKKHRELKAPEERRRVADWHKTNPRKSRNKSYRRKYGITLEDYDRILVLQNGKCAICKSSDAGTGKNFCVDHNHISSKVRELLCSRCNQALGLVHERVEVLQFMIEYLNKHSDHSYTGVLRSATNAENSVQF